MTIMDCAKMTVRLRDGKVNLEGLSLDWLSADDIAKLIRELQSARRRILQEAKKLEAEASRISDMNG